MTSPRSVGIVSASLIAVAGVALVPAFYEASDQLNFSSIQYGGQLELVLAQMPLMVALIAALLLAFTFIKT